MMNSVYPFLKFTVKTEEDFENLDMEMFMEDVEHGRTEETKS